MLNSEPTPEVSVGDETMRNSREAFKLFRKRRANIAYRHVGFIDALLQPA